MLLALVRPGLSFGGRMAIRTINRADGLQSRKQASVIASVSACLLAALLFTGCAVRIIGDYDDTIDKGVTDVQQKAEEYFVKLQSNPNTPYDQGFYDDINVRLVLLKSRAAALPRYPIILEQLTNLKSEFDTFQELDKPPSSRPFPKVAVTAAESAIAVSVESILKLELALKARGQPAAPSLTKTSK
jgi:hypothetical protein